jgi:hypothetical protein
VAVGKRQRFILVADCLWLGWPYLTKKNPIEETTPINTAF